MRTLCIHRASAHRLLVGLTVTLAVACAIGPVAAGGPQSPGQPVGRDPAFFPVRSLALTLPNGDDADVYVPRIAPGGHSEGFPVVAVLQGANVDKSHYQHLGAAIARQGFVVVIPNHFRDFPDFGRVLFSEVGVVNDVYAAMVEENATKGSPLKGLIDISTMGLIGHSLGGSVALYSIAGVCAPAICSQFAPGYQYEPPAALHAAAVYGVNLVGADGSVTDLNSLRAAVALVQGSLDGVAFAQKAAPTYGTLEPSRALMEVAGANHYGICDENNPPGARPDPNVPTLSQEAANDAIGDLIGLWLRTQLKGTHQ